MKKNEGNIYLLKDNPNCGYPSLNKESPHPIRTYSKPSNGVKISLKQTSGTQQQPKFPNYNIKSANNSFDLKDNRPASLNKHEHRFKFMMDNLNY
jgi:hypothetical protein